MNYVIFRDRPSDSATALATALEGTRYVKPETIGRLLEKPDRRLVYWGSFCQSRLPKAQTLNGVAVGNKLKDALTLIAANVPTITISVMKPIPEMALDTTLAEMHQQLAGMTEDFLEALTANPQQLRTNIPFKAGVGEIHNLLGLYINQLNVTLPAPVEWLGRLRTHVAGADLITPPTSPDYWVKKESIAREFRVHSFLGRSIRAGQKVTRDEFKAGNGTADYDDPRPMAHNWIRTFDCGWRISYDGETVQQKHRDIAHQAISALGLDFGAVDVAERPDGSVFVLEVNRAPGIEAGTIEAYSRAIRKWAGEEVS